MQLKFCSHLLTVQNDFALQKKKEWISFSKIYLENRNFFLAGRKKKTKKKPWPEMDYFLSCGMEIWRHVQLKILCRLHINHTSPAQHILVMFPMIDSANQKNWLERAASKRGEKKKPLPKLKACTESS